MHGAWAALALTLLASPAFAGPRCGVPGAAALTALPNIRYILVGEMHGTDQSPAEFGDLVCALAKSGRKVVVGIEFFQSEQGSLDRFLASDGGPAATKALIGGDWWRLVRSGQTSVAMLALIERMRVLKRTGVIEDLRAFNGAVNDDPGDAYERDMATSVRQLSAFYPGDLAVILLGQVHASKNPVAFGGPAYRPAAMWLPQDQTISLQQVNRDGRAWNCLGTTPPDCGPHEDDGDSGPRGVRLVHVTDVGRYDGVLASGEAATASPPAVR